MNFWPIGLAIRLLMRNHPEPVPACPRLRSSCRSGHAVAFLIGGLTPLTENSGIYFSASHVLEGLPMSDLERSFAVTKPHMRASEFRFCHARRNPTGLPLDSPEATELDFVLTVPKPLMSEILVPDDDPGHCGQKETERRWKLNPDYQIGGRRVLAEHVGIGDDYVAYMLGTLGPEEKESRKLSCGKVSELEPFGYFDLSTEPTCADNMAGAGSEPTPRASGAIVYTRSGGPSG